MDGEEGKLDSSDRLEGTVDSLRDREGDRERERERAR